MRIGIDGYNLAIPNGTGVATYGYTLARTLQSLGHRVDGLFGIDAGGRAEMHELLFFERFGLGNRVNGAKASQPIARIAASTALDWMPRRPVPIRISDRIDRRAFTYRLPSFDTLWSSPYLFEVAYARFRYFGRFLTVSMPDPPDVMHWTYPLPIRVAGAKNVYTLHDLVPLRLPHTTLDEKPYYYRLIRKCVASADHLCTVSDSSLADIVRYFPEAESKIANTYQSSPIPDEVLSSNPADDAAIIKGMFGLDNKDYFLFFGAADPKKNLGRIIDAYLTANVSTPLVIVSARDWGMNEETRMLGAGGQVYGRSMGQRIVRLEYLPRTTLFRLIRTAKAVLFPSLLEGFGLPALEAIQLGTPVVSSDVSSLPEVVGDAGLLVDPYKVHEIAAAIRAIDSETELRARLLANGPAQSAKFSDAAYRQRLTDFYARFTARD